MFERVGPELRQVIYTEVEMSSAWLMEKEEHTLPLIYAAALGLDPSATLSIPYFYSYATHYRLNLADTDKYFLTVCLLLLTSELNLCICPPYSVESRFIYTPARRCVFRKVMGWFMESVDAAFLCNCAEELVAEFIAEKELHAHLPDEITQQVAALGPAEYHKQATTSDVSIFDRILGKILSIGVSNPNYTHIALKYQYKGLKELPALNATLVISGWSSEADDIKNEWQGLTATGAVYGLVWEAGSFLSSAWKFVKGASPRVIRLVAKGVSKASPYAKTAVIGAVCVCLRDFTIACQNATITGKQLARHIQEHVFGFVPISLIGFSMGCRVIYYCLKELSRTSNKCYIQDVILLGGAAKNDPVLWDRLLKCVAGRAINVYSSRDDTLKYCYRSYMIFKPPPIGLGPVLCTRMENFDASGYITGHQDHRKHLAETLVQIRYLS